MFALDCLNKIKYVCFNIRQHLSCRFAGKVSTWYLMPFRKIQLFNWCCVPANCLNFYAVSSTGTEHWDEDIYLCEYVFVCFCVSVCVSACEHISGSNHFCARFASPTNLSSSAGVTVHYVPVVFNNDVMFVRSGHEWDGKMTYTQSDSTGAAGGF